MYKRFKAIVFAKKRTENNLKSLAVASVFVVVLLPSFASAFTYDDYLTFTQKAGQVLAGGITAGTQNTASIYTQSLASVSETFDSISNYFSDLWQNVLPQSTVISVSPTPQPVLPQPPVVPVVAARTPAFQVPVPTVVLQPAPEPPHSSAQPTQVVVQRVLSGVTVADLDTKIEQLRNELLSRIGAVAGQSQAVDDGNYHAISLTNKIDQLTNTTINTPSITGGTLTNTTISGGTISGSTISGTTLSVSSGTFSGNLTVGGTATSTFAGDSNFSGGTLYVNSLNGRVGVGTTSPTDTLSVNGPVFLSDVTPSATTNRLYSNAGSLYWNGSLVGGGAVGNWTLASGNVYRATGNVGIGTTTPGSPLSLAGIVNFTTATSTFYGNGLNLTSGCFAIGGNCVGTNASSITTGTLSIANGGTASTTLGGILAGNGIGAIKSVSIGSNLTWDGSTLSALGSGTVGSGTTGQFGFYAGNGTTLTGTTSGATLTNLDATQLTSSTTERDFYGNYFLRNWNNQIAGIKTANATTVPAVVLYMGDSWTAGESITAPLRATLQNKLGNAGSGYISLGTIDGPPSGATISSSGTWTTINAVGKVGADLYAAATTDSATPAQKVITTQANAFVISYLTQVGGGQFSYSIDGVGTTTVDTNGGSTAFASVTVTTTNAQHILRIQDVTANTAGVILLGVDAQITGIGGARVEMIGHSGAAASTYNGVDVATWKSAMTSINPNIVFIMLGVNDANVGGMTPATQKANMATLVANTQAALPNVDIVLIPQPQNGNTPTYDMTLYDYAQEDLARSNGLGFVDLNHYMGPFGTNKYAFWKANFHPSTLGGQMIADIIERLLVNGMDNFLNTINFTSYDGSNTFIGKNIGGSITTGNSDTYLGDGVGGHTTSGSLNTALGYLSLGNLTTGNNNVAMGRLALYNNVTGSSNTAIGWNAQYNGTNGGNTSLGASTLFTNVTGSEETAIGNQALYQTTREQNTAVGNNAGYNITNGHGDTFLGDNAGYTDGTTQTSASIVNATAIGFNAQVTASNSLVLGGIGAYAVNVGIGTSSPNANFTLQGTAGQTQNLFKIASSTGASVFSIDSNGGVTVARGNENTGLSPIMEISGTRTVGTFNDSIFQPIDGLGATLNVTATDNSGDYYGNTLSTTYNGTTNTGGVAGGINIGSNNAVGPNILTNVYGSYNIAENTNGGTITNAVGSMGRVFNNIGTITNAYGFKSVVAPTGATNGYGLFVNPLSGATNSYAIYTAGANDKSYFAGNVGIGTSSPASTLTVTGSACISKGAGATAACSTTAGTITANVFNTAAADVAERYSVSDPSVDAGTIVAVDPNHPLSVMAAGNTTTAIGIVSTEPGVLLGTFNQGGEASTTVPVALSGRVPVKVDLEGGDIHTGDRIALSSTLGIGMKATTSGETIGVALQDFTASSAPSGTGTVLAFVNLTWSHLDPAIANGTIGTNQSSFWDIDRSSGRIKYIAPVDFNDFDLIGVKAITGSAGKWSIDANGDLVVNEVQANKVTTQVFCIDDVCVDKDKLKAMISGSVQGGGSSNVQTQPQGNSLVGANDSEQSATSTASTTSSSGNGSVITPSPQASTTESTTSTSSPAVTATQDTSSVATSSNVFASTTALSN